MIAGRLAGSRCIGTGGRGQSKGDEKQDQSEADAAGHNTSTVGLDWDSFELSQLEGRQCIRLGRFCGIVGRFCGTHEFSEDV
jgi:hypothetical protein